jgi:Cytidylyltransferase C-terminal domain (DUF2432).
MQPRDLLPKRVANYIKDIGVRALDHLAGHLEAAAPPTAPEGEGSPTAPVDATQTLVHQWKAMAVGDKEEFVDRVAASVMEVIVASATLPLGLKVGRKTVKVAKKVIRKRVKRVRKAVAKSAKSPKKKVGEGKRKKKKA